MSEMTHFTLSRQFTDLIGRKVTFVQVKTGLPTKERQVYGVYTLFPAETTIVVKADLLLLGACAGALVGLPDADVRRHLQSTPIEELLRDAMYEVLNVAAAVVAVKGRAVLTQMVTGMETLPAAAAAVLAKPANTNNFTVSVEGYQGGKFAVLA
jgi:hypothetical protein